MDKPAFSTADTEKMLRLPVGAISPLWLMFAGAATMGAAFYWGRSLLKATNLEALTALPERAADVAAGTIESPAEAAAETVEVTAEAAPQLTEAVEAAVEPVVEAVVESADDLTVLTGIGPKLAAAFAERGVTRFAQIAAWTEEDVAKFDKDLKLMGRVTREAWIAQATRLASTN